MKFQRVFAVFKKEMRRFLFDKRMLCALFLPGVMIFVLYTILGQVIDSVFTNLGVEPDYSYKIAINEEGKSAEFEATLLSYFSQTEQAAPSIEYYTVDLFEDEMDKLRNGEIDSVMLFTFSSGELKDVKAYYNSSSASSETLFALLPSLIDATFKTYQFNQGIDPNVGSESFMENTVIGFILPMITISILYSTVLSICPESIAGEKERGTLLKVLATPITPAEFAAGKLLALSLLSILSGSVNAICTIFATPQLLGDIKLNIGFGGYVLYFFAVVSLLLLFISFATLISSLAKSTKEANSYLGPGAAVAVLIALIPSFADLSSIGFAFVPFINSCACLTMVARGQIDYLFFGMTVLANLILTGIITFLTDRAFKSERIMIG